MSFSVCYTHKSCPDGIASAWIVKNHGLNPNCKIIPISHKEPFIHTDETGNLIFVDFCPDRDILEKLVEQYDSILIIDHHQLKYDPVELPNVKLKHDENKAACQLCASGRRALRYL